MVFRLEEVAPEAKRVPAAGHEMRLSRTRTPLPQAAVHGQAQCRAVARVPSASSTAPCKKRRRPSAENVFMPPVLLGADGFQQRALDFWQFVFQALKGGQAEDSVCRTFDLGGSIDCLGDVAFFRDEITARFMHKTMHSVWYGIVS